MNSTGKMILRQTKSIRLFQNNSSFKYTIEFNWCKKYSHKRGKIKNWQKEKRQAMQSFWTTFISGISTMKPC
jgi:tmRNA-binding protein